MNRTHRDELDAAELDLLELARYGVRGDCCRAPERVCGMVNPLTCQTHHAEEIQLRGLDPDIGQPFR
jgi:hypothetical protein